MDKLDRFRQAQDVFPQLAGLGQSSPAVHYGLAGGEEAAAYLRDRVLGERLIAAAAAVRAHLSRADVRPTRLAGLIGSEIDARKLVSCMTLFGHVAKTLHATEPRPELAAMAAHADAILAAAAAQGYARCAYTAGHLR